MSAVANAQISSAELELIGRIRRGEASAFERLVDAHGASLLRVATHHTRSRAVAEEVVQETWMAFLQGLERFEGRSTLRTWLFGILVNRARKTAQREGRSVAVAGIAGEAAAHDVDPDRFMPDGVRWAGHWRLDDLSVWPRAWSELPENRLLGGEVRAEIGKALEGLPTPQRMVFILRDVEGFSAAEVCDVLELTDANQRVLLHRARSRIREHLEHYFEE